MKIKLMILLCSIFLLSGCWNYNELNTLAIATGMAIDKEGDDYKVSFLIANSKKEQASTMEGEAQTIIFKGKGKTITEAMRNVETLSPKKIYISHLSIVILSEEIAKNNLKTVNDYLLRNPASIKRFYTVIANERKAEEILKVISPLESFPSQNIFSNIRTSSDSQGVSTIFPYSEFVENIMQKGREAYLPLISISGNPEQGKSQESLMEVELPAILKTENVALFKGEKMVTKIKNADETIGINLASDNIDEMSVQTKCKKNYINTILTSVSSKPTVTLKNNNPQVIVKVRANGKMNEVSCDINLEDNKVMKEIENDIEMKVRQIILRGIKIAQNNKTDIYGFGNLFYKKYPDYFKSVENKWNDQIFPAINPIIEVDIHLTSKGSIQKTIEEEKYGE